MKEPSNNQPVTPGTIEVDLFSEDVDSEEHPMASQFREMLEEAATDHDCELVTFAVDKGMVSFSFDDDVLTAKILSMLKQNQDGG